MEQEAVESLPLEVLIAVLLQVLQVKVEVAEPPNPMKFQVASGWPPRRHQVLAWSQVLVQLVVLDRSVLLHPSRP